MKNPFNRLVSKFWLETIVCLTLLLIPPATAVWADYVIETESTLSWVALGKSQATFSAEGEGFSTNEVGSSGNRYQPAYQALHLYYSLGIDWTFANFFHLQPFLAYGLGYGNFQLSHTASDGTQRTFPKKEGITDIGIYGVNLILEVSGKFWLGMAQNYFLESRTFNYENLGQTRLEPAASTAFMLVWNWERVPITPIDPRASFFNF